MIRSVALPFVLLASSAAFLGPAFATTNQYRAELSKPASDERFVVRDLVWHCVGGSCTAAQTTSRPGTDCAALADKVGALRSFSVAGEPLAPDALEKCNARAH